MSAAIDITAEQRKILLALLRRFIPGVAVWAYGSRVKWTARPNSDLDLVAFTTPDQRPLVSELKDELAESNLPFLVDFHIWDEVPERFREIIRKEYVVLQEAEAKRERGVPDKWRRTTWGEEISLEYGKALRGYEKAIGRIRVYGTNGPVGWTTRPLAHGPGVILGRKGAYRGVHYSADPFFVIDTAYYVVPKTALDMRWLYYAIRHHKLGEINDGSPIPSTTRAAVYVRSLEVPPLPEQRAIAGVLGALDDKIESNRRTSRMLERVARAIFRAWFVDFEPVKAKAAGARSFPGMSQEAFDALPTRLVESELGPVPEGWEVLPLGKLIELAYGKPLKAEDRKTGAVRVYGANGPIGWHDEKLVCGPGIVVGRKGNPGVVTWVSGDFYPIDTTFYVVTIGGCRSLYFLYYALLFHDLANLSADSAVPGLNRNHAYMSKQVVPKQEVLEVFDSQISPIFAAINANDQQSRALAALRDYLLPKLLSGEVRVVEADNPAIPLKEVAP